MVDMDARLLDFRDQWTTDQVSGPDSFPGHRGFAKEGFESSRVYVCGYP